MLKEQLKSYTILYAEDDRALQKSTKEYLERYFKTVYIANDGKEALQRYEDCNPDVMLLDIDMPCINGLEVARKIRSTNETIPIMILTAFSDTALLLQAVELNLCKYLIKPMGKEAFQEALENVSERLMKCDSDVIFLKEGYKWLPKEERLVHHKETVFLTQKEFVLLKLFISHKGELVSFEEIMAVVWEDDFDKEISLSSVKYHVSMLRNKIPSGCVTNVYGKGYIFKT
jgi:DNA-binding response OmpR family regulator